MWEFMSKYAESFWQAGEYAEEVFMVIMAWIITAGLAGIVLGLMHLIAMKIKWIIEDIAKERKDHGL